MLAILLFSQGFLDKQFNKQKQHILYDSMRQLLDFQRNIPLKFEYHQSFRLGVSFGSFIYIYTCQHRFGHNPKQQIWRLKGLTAGC